MTTASAMEQERACDLVVPEQTTVRDDAALSAYTASAQDVFSAQRDRTSESVYLNSSARAMLDGFGLTGLGGDSTLPGRRLDLAGMAPSTAGGVSEFGSVGEGAQARSNPLDGVLIAQNTSDLPDRLGTASDAATAVNLASRGRYGNNPFFNPSSGALGLVTGFDVSPATVAGYVSAAWGRLGALNDALSGRRPQDFGPITGPDGKPAVIVMPQHWYQRNPSVTLNIDGKNEDIKMDLPGFRGHAVTLVTDGRRVLAIDPKNNDVWQLQRDELFGATTGYSWTRISRR